MTYRSAALAVVLVFTLATLASCSSDSAEPVADEPAAVDTAAPADPAEPAAGDALSITGVDYAFDAPMEVAAGEYTLEFINDGAEFHQAIIVELLEGKTMDDVLAYIEKTGPDSGPPSWARVAGLAEAAPGESVEGMPSKADGQPSGEPGTPVDLTAGTYAIVCLIPEGSTSRDAKPAKDAKPHVMLGMGSELIVT